ncbi:hypothetical protein MWU58_00485 [Flavobacteriaceae bacterium S0825]|uniref:hypothetical protein n=1 Tax=Gaetbulibacter sp. S0825 TaxID=2720084 RepID=UPI00143050E6|nr:hypothetical protein [Gaetbulibacter sp. S0825]MCK0107756.1 hypothetical protein [Flavobacteriaceae bacterium S0825]NIX63392.1 hypothetical protein [Gaetbulibacter sp. S0825]
MIDKIFFINHQWLWQTVITTLCIWLVFIWKERTKLRKKSFYVNCTISLIALLSLALIALKPSVKNSSTSFKLAIITNGYNNVQLDSLKKVYKKLTVYSYKENQALFPSYKHPETLFILGDGLQPYDLWQLDAINTIYIGGDAPKGISHFAYNTQNTVGNKALFSGKYVRPIKGHKLLLEDPAGKALDSIILNNDDSQEFQLSTNLKVKGAFVYQLVEKDSVDNIIKKDPLPLTIKEKQPLHFLIVNASPSFETKYLKNYLAEAGHKVLVRSRLTKDRYKYEYFNMENKPTIRFTQEELKTFDIVIIDLLSLTGLSNNAKNAFETSIKADGLGVFIQPESNLFNSRSRWYSFNFISNTKNTTSLEISPKNTISKFPFVFKNDISVESVLNDNSNIISGYKRVGIGRIGTSVLKNTFELQLKGKTEIYKQLWAITIESIGKKETPIIEWNSNLKIAYVNEPFSFELRATIENPIVTTKNYQIPIKRDIDIKDLWKGVTYPKSTGWNILQNNQDTTKIFKFYTINNSHWQTLKANNTIKSNKRYFGTNKPYVDTNNSTSKPINPLWFFIIFVLNLGYLWLVPKL